MSTLDYLPFTPTIGVKGSFIVDPIFSNRVIANKEYTIVELRQLVELVKSRENVLNTVYISQGLTHDDYVDGIANGALIISLRSIDDVIVKIPSNYLLGVPAKQGIKYQNIGMSVDIGSMPFDFNFEWVRYEVEELFKKLIGAQVSTVKLENSPIFYLDREEDIVLRHDLKQTITNYPNPEDRILELETINAALTNKLIALENFISLSGTALDLCNLCPECPDCPEIPDCPDCPDCPEIPDCPDCPGPDPIIDPIPDPTPDPDIDIIVDPGCTDTKRIAYFKLNMSIERMIEDSARACCDDINVDADVDIAYKVVPDCETVFVVRDINTDDCCC